MSEQLEAAIRNVEGALGKAEAQADPRQVIGLTLVAVNHLISAVAALERKAEK